jgi:hypothetical protein
MQKVKATTAMAMAASLAVLTAFAFPRAPDRKPVVKFLGFTHVLDRRVARFSVSNTTERALLITSLPPNGYLPTPVEPARMDYVDVPNPMTNRFWPAELQFQTEARPWRKILDEARHGRLGQAGLVFRQSLGTNHHRYFIARREFNVSFKMDD